MGREQWSSGPGFVLASIGSAVGIGNIWRFPYMVGVNGGGAFLIPYLIALFLFGLPLLILELALGRHFRTSVVPAFGTRGRPFRLAGFVLVFLLRPLGGDRLRGGAEWLLRRPIEVEPFFFA